MNRLLFTIAAILLLAPVAAQIVPAKEDQPVETPKDRQYDDHHCWEYEMKMLGQAIQATTDADVLLYTHKADAYARMDANGQTCQ